MTDNTTPPTSGATPAGWYPDQADPSLVRYWDGAQWTGHTQPAVAAEPTAIIATPPKPKRKLKWWQWGLVGVGAFLVLVITIGSINGAGKDDDTTTAAAVEEGAEVTVPDVVGKTAKEAWVLLDNAGLDATFSADEGVVIDRDNWLVQSSEPGAGATVKTGDSVVLNVKKKAPPVDTRVTVPNVVGKTVAEAVTALAAVNITLTVPAEMGQDWVVTSQTVPGGTKIKPGDPLSIQAEAPKPVYTLAQQNAIQSAQSYLRNVGGFSRQGLIDQMLYEQFSQADAEFAVDNSGADWNDQAKQSAESYMKNVGGFSRGSLYDQLAYEGFTPEQIEFALAAVGY
jgi:hypothetical protein